MRIALLFVMVSSALTSCASRSSAPSPSLPDHEVTFGSAGTPLLVRVADTPSERDRGLMGVTNLPADQGMAFVFDGPTSVAFWMKDTLIPLSIAFVAGNRIVAIREMEPCTADPCPTYDAGGASYTMAIEANTGYFQNEGIQVGDRANLVSVAYA